MIDIVGYVQDLLDSFRASPWFSSLYALATIATVGLVIDYARMLNLRRKMPPGPFPWPIVGNTFMLPDVKPWFYFEELSKKYNAPLITFWIGRNPTVWLNDAWAASELLDKRAAIYSSRPHMVVFGDLGSGDWNLVTMKYGERWYHTLETQSNCRRVHRKITHQGVGMQQVRSYRQNQNNESKIIALDLIKEPKKYVAHFERYAASVVSIIAYGRRIQSYLDPIITEVIWVMHIAADLNVPGKSFPMLMETFPILAKFPNWMAPWKKGVGGRRRGKDFFYFLAKEANEESPHENFSREIFDLQEKYDLSPAEISAISGNLFGAGSDTSASTLITFVLAAVMFPETVAKAQKEIDEVVGPDRSPDFDDLLKMPYVEAFVKEVFRWRSVAIIGGQPHAPVQDDYYNGWYIPAGTWVQGNLWYVTFLYHADIRAIHRNPRDFPEPDRFNPDRYLKENRLPYPNDKGYHTFGWGRRVCSGQALAEQGTSITIARLLWGFNFLKERDGNGREIDIDIFNYTNGLNWRPQPFDCIIQPRSERHTAAIKREGEQALSELEKYNGKTKYRMFEFMDKVARGEKIE